MRLFLVVLCAFLFSSCAAGNGEFSRNIKEHAFSNRKAVLMGEGVSPEAASRVAKQSGAMVFYSTLSTHPPVITAKTRSEDVRLDNYMKGLATSFRDMAASGDDWDIMVAERARAALTAVLLSMNDQELANLKAKFTLSTAARGNAAFQAQIKRVMGPSVVFEYSR